MNRRRLMLELGLLLVVVLAVGILWMRRQTAPPARAQPPVVDLTRHDGQTVDFSSGQPVVKDAPADKAALNQAVKEMNEAAKDVTFAPSSPPSNADQKPPAPAPKP